MSMKMKIISTLALTTAFTFASSSALAAEAISHGAPAPVAGPSHVMNNNMGTPVSGMGAQKMQYDVLNNEIGYISDSSTGMGLLGNRIRVTGYMNVGAFGQQDRGFLMYAPVAGGSNSSNQSAINYSGRLFFMADANNWIHANLGLQYAGTKDPIGISGNAFTSSRYYGEGYTYVPGVVGIPVVGGGLITSTGDLNIDSLQVDQAYVDIRDFSRAPFAVRIGRAYTPFGTYDLNAMLPTFAQQMETTRADLIQASYSGRMGLYGAIYGFNGLNKRDLTAPSPEHFVNPLSNADDEFQNGGIEVGYHGQVNNYGSFHFNVAGGYVFNILDSNLFYRYLQDYGSTDCCGAWNLHGDILVGAFGLTANYVTTTGDLANADFVRVTHGRSTGARPAAGNIYGTFHFVTYGHRSALRAGYEWTRQAQLFSNPTNVAVNTTVTTANGFIQSVAMPKERLALQYNVDVLANTTLGMIVAYDNAYSKADGGSGDHSTTEMVRLTVAM